MSYTDVSCRTTTVSVCSVNIGEDHEKVRKRLIYWVICTLPGERTTDGWDRRLHVLNRNTHVCRLCRFYTGGCVLTSVNIVSAHASPTDTTDPPLPAQVNPSALLIPGRF